MTHLHSFMVTGGLWETNLPEMLPLEPQGSGSPSTRSWKAFYARPQTYDVKHHAKSCFQYAISALR